MSRFFKSLFPFVTKTKYNRDITARDEVVKQCMSEEYILIDEILEIINIHEEAELGSFSLSQSILKIIFRRLEEKHD
tara:strand:+ start:258 stop:488 length:231 start_codon:yes stop_codon:yes gene_type:complete